MAVTLLRWRSTFYVYNNAQAVHNIRDYRELGTKAANPLGESEVSAYSPTALYRNK